MVADGMRQARKAARLERESPEDATVMTHSDLLYLHGLAEVLALALPLDDRLQARENTLEMKPKSRTHAAMRRNCNIRGIWSLRTDKEWRTA